MSSNDNFWTLRLQLLRIFNEAAHESSTVYLLISNSRSELWWYIPELSVPFPNSSTIRRLLSVARLIARHICWRSIANALYAWSSWEHWNRSRRLTNLWYTFSYRDSGHNLIGDPNNSALCRYKTAMISYRSPIIDRAMYEPSDMRQIHDDSDILTFSDLNLWSVQ